jgi:hypothetical protein
VQVEWCPQEEKMSSDISAMSVREIKLELNALGIEYEGCVERSDLVKKLQDARGGQQMIVSC